VKPASGDGYWVYAGTGIRIRYAKPREIDELKEWRPW
jgi:hypothetical protein